MGIELVTDTEVSFFLKNGKSLQNRDHDLENTIVEIKCWIYLDSEETQYHTRDSCWDRGKDPESGAFVTSPQPALPSVFPVVPPGQPNS